ncbi:MAG TPA: hypothetical protein PLS63_06320 [Microthrixaceae bacterium]|nr:hypothetical protein [Microthrixaceae bacterium]
MDHNNAFINKPADPTTRAIRRARSAAVLAEPRLQIGFDRRSGKYSLALL